MAKSKSTKKAASAKELEARLGPVRRVVRLVKARDTENAYNLFLECKHTRVGTKRKHLRCARCRKGAK